MLIEYLLWQCPECNKKWQDDRTPREAQVYCVHGKKEVRMNYIGTIQL